MRHLLFVWSVVAVTLAGASGAQAQKSKAMQAFDACVEKCMKASGGAKQQHPSQQCTKKCSSTK